jgi:ribonucleoside-diphosphate reductase alpha chain
MCRHLVFHKLSSYNCSCTLLCNALQIINIELGENTLNTVQMPEAAGAVQLDMLLKENEYKLKTEKFHKRMMKWLSRNENADQDRTSKKMIQMAMDSIDIDAPEWTYVAAGELLRMMYREAGRTRGYKGSNYGSLYELIKMLPVPLEGKKYAVYKPELLDTYTEAEINELSATIDPEKDKLFSYIGLFLLNDRYLARPDEGVIYELPQERFMIIAMDIMRQEDPAYRLDLVKEAYWALSNLYMTVATPTLSNAGKTHGQLSSCFIDFVDDNLDSIYLTNRDIANVSKYGGGVGLYMGKVRSRGSDIRGYAGTSSGITPWIKQYDQTAVSVDQLGQRKGAIAIYNDIWHKDIFPFLELKTANGDERDKAHNIFTGVSIPDIFMERVRDRQDWYLFDPHTIQEVLGFALEDFYDEEVGPEGNGLFRQHYQKAIDAAEAGKLPFYAWEKVQAIDVMKSIMTSQLEEGTPFMFYRDEVNRQNPNKHIKGIGITSIYSSNLCTEIMQNMSPTLVSEEVLDEETGKIIITRDAGDFVVCNLSSISLAKAVMDDVLERLIKIQVRMLDNVIDINTLPVKQATYTNKRYRPLGLGTFGWHHLLALKGIHWESEEAVELADTLYEDIAFLTIQASMELAKERGAYKLFEGSEWDTGKYFERRGYEDERWLQLKEDVHNNGVRNAYLMAVAPNSSTAKIGDSTDGIDPIYDVAFIEEKKNFKINVVAPDLTPANYDYYRTNRFLLDQKWSIRQNVARQRHIDQSISFNLYVISEIKAADLLELHLMAWELGLKTTYYIRSTAAANVPGCDFCQ